MDHVPMTDGDQWAFAVYGMALKLMSVAFRAIATGTALFGIAVEFSAFFAALTAWAAAAAGVCLAIASVCMTASWVTAREAARAGKKLAVAAPAR